MNSDKIINLDAIDSTFRGYAWDYFSLHSDQRMKSFHFYIIIVTAIIGGLAVIVKSTELRKVYSLFGVALILLSFLFWKLDQRTRQLIKYAEEAIIYLDEKYLLPDCELLHHPLKIFSREINENKTARAFPLISGHFSYARVFRWIFLFFSLVGLGISIIFLLIIHCDQKDSMALATRQLPLLSCAIETLGYGSHFLMCCYSHPPRC